ncbi:hypothetical protein K501DRAFT_259434 [Backusella circina FSU 941]|nr:hypothetical protein K501DRAFT_259434 [Backusella circina FSU 941]
MNSHHNTTAITPLQSFISSNTVADVLNKVKPVSNNRPLYDLPVTASVEEAFDLLLKQNILAVPIYQQQENEDKKYLAIVSAFDLLKLLGTQLDDKKVLEKQLVEAVGMTDESKHMTVLESTDSFVKLLEFFSLAHIHRVLVKDSSNQYVMLSQMDMLRFLQANNHKLGSSVLDITVPDIRQHHHTLVRTDYKSTAAECFLKLVQNLTQSALPILDNDQDEFIGEVSARDLRGITKDRWETLQKPIVMYLKESQGDLHLPFTCKDHFTLSQIMTSCVLRETYRLWWLDQNDTLKGVISITDILATILGVATNTSK